jgi:hypothetical protein
MSRWIPAAAFWGSSYPLSYERTGLGRGAEGPDKEPRVKNEADQKKKRVGLSGRN